jgi:hypothetical protein
MISRYQIIGQRIAMFASVRASTCGPGRRDRRRYSRMRSFMSHRAATAVAGMYHYGINCSAWRVL